MALIGGCSRKSHSQRGIHTYAKPWHRKPAFTWGISSRSNLFGTSCRAQAGLLLAIWHGSAWCHRCGCQCGWEPWTWGQGWRAKGFQQESSQQALLQCSEGTQQALLLCSHANLPHQKREKRNICKRLSNSPSRADRKPVLGREPGARGHSQGSLPHPSQGRCRTPARFKDNQSVRLCCRFGA
jgi:hypothetical protein